MDSFDSIIVPQGFAQHRVTLPSALRDGKHEPKRRRDPAAPGRGQSPSAALHRVLVAAALALSLGALPPNPLEAQRVILRDARPQLRLEASRVTTLGVPDGDGAIGTRTVVARDSDGRFLVVSEEFSYKIQIFSPTGAYVREAGRRGQGPGEFGDVVKILPLGDSIHVYDMLRRRHSVLSKDLEFVRGEPVPLSPLGGGTLPMPGGILVANAIARTPDAIGNPLHVLRDGTVANSFGYDGGFVMPGTGLDWRALWPSSDGRFWAARRLSYVIEEWTVDGRKTRELVRQASWFPGSEPNTSLAEGPQPRLTDLQQDDDGRLWALATVPDERWRETLTVGDPDADGNRFRIVDPHRWRDTMIEVIDPDRGEIIASRHVDPLFRFLLAPGYVALSRVTADNSVVEVWRLTLEPIGGQRRAPYGSWWPPPRLSSPRGRCQRLRSRRRAGAREMVGRRA